jgi:hypothetical protein
VNGTYVSSSKRLRASGFRISRLKLLPYLINIFSSIYKGRVWTKPSEKKYVGLKGISLYWKPGVLTFGIF